MTFLRKIIIPAIVVAAFACSADKDNTRVDQRTKIESFLDGREAGYEIFDDVYRHIGNEDRAGRENATTAEIGDEIHCRFDVYQFTSSRQLPAVWSNRDEVIEALREAGLSAVYWPRHPEIHTVGKTSNIINSVDRALPGVRLGDSVSFYVISEKAYGGNYAGPLLQDACMEFVLWIDNVIKN